MPPKNPTPTQPTSDFDKFTRAVPPSFTGAIPDDVLGTIKSEAPSEAPATDQQQVTVPTAPTRLNPEQQAEASFRASLREWEAQIAAGPKAPAHPIHVASSVVPSALGGGQAPPMIREGADPLHVASFTFLTRIVAGGSPLLAMLDTRALSAHIAALRKAIEWVPKTEPVVSS